MTGGSAAQSGFDFQSKIAAEIAVYILAEEPYAAFDLSQQVFPVSLHPEAPTPVDDILVRTSEGGRCFINVKRSVSLTDKHDASLGAVIDQFVRQYLSCDAGTGANGWDVPLRPEHDRLLLFTGRDRSARFTNITRSLLGKLSLVENPETIDKSTMTEDENFAFAALRSLISHFYKLHAGKAPANSDMHALLRLIRVADFGPANDSWSPAIAMIRRNVVSNPADAEAAWLSLTDEMVALAIRRSPIGASALRQRLERDQLVLSSSTRNLANIERLKQVTRETLSGESQFSSLRIPDHTTSQTLRIERPSTEAIVSLAKRTSFLVLGEPGAGKSGSLCRTVEQLLEAGIPVVFLAVDRHPVASLSALRRDLDLSAPFTDVLSAWSGPSPGVLVIDALDAARGGASDLVFQSLIREVLTSAKNWTVIASIREFDLRFGQAYRQLFQGRPVSPDFSHPEFPNVSHILIPRLNSDELSQVWRESPSMANIYSAGDASLKNLLTSPFNLLLLASILSDDPSASFLGVATQISLLDRYWSHRVVGNDNRHIARERFLMDLLARMLKQRALTIDESVLNEISAGVETELLSAGVLIGIKWRRDQIRLIAFSHHVLFDYAVARLVFRGGVSDDFVAKLTHSDDVALLLSPAAILALRMLWDDDKDDFWSKATDLAIATGAGAFCRMLPARVAAESTATLGDWQPVFRSLSANTRPANPGTVFLVRHALGVLSTKAIAASRIFGADAAPWAEIVQELCTLAPHDLRYAAREFLHRASEFNGKLSDKERVCISFVARRIIEISIQDPYAEDGIAIAIKPLFQTFDADPTGTSATVLEILKPTNVAVHGHNDLLWIAFSIGHLLNAERDSSLTIKAIYLTAFTSPLPSRDEQTSMGNSRILPLLSNKRQELESARYHLAENFEKFLSRYPRAAIESVLELAAIEVGEDKLFSPKNTTFVFRGIQTVYRPDGSALWRSFQKNDFKALYEIFQTYVLRQSWDGGIELFEEIIEITLSSNSSACAWATLLETASHYPLLLADQMLDALTSVPILDGMDTRLQSGRLLAAAFSDLKRQDQLSIQAAILKCSEHSQRILLGCIPVDQLTLPEAHERRRSLESAGGILANEDPFRFDIISDPDDEVWWKGQNRDQALSRAETTCKELVESIESKISSSRNQTNNAGIGSELLPLIVPLAEQLSLGDQVSDHLACRAWHCVAQAIDVEALAVTSAAQFQNFDLSLNLILRCVQDTFEPLPIYDAEAEARFEASPAWGSPAPRIPAAQALMSISRALSAVPSNLKPHIERLATDPVASVRYQILSRVNFLWTADQALCRDLIDRAARSELNRGVLNALLQAIRPLVHIDPAWFSNRLIRLDTKLSGSTSPENQDSPLTFLIVALWVEHDDVVAEGIVRSWAADPITHARRIHSLITYLRAGVLLGNPRNATDRENSIRARTFEVYDAVTTSALQRFDALSKLPAAISPDSETVFNGIGQALNLVAMELYFGSGSFDGGSVDRAHEQTAPDEVLALRTRFLQEFSPVLKKLSRAPHPAITHHVLQIFESYLPVSPALVFEMAMDALLDGGRKASYATEHLGVGLFVQIVRRFLADYRNLVVENKAIRLKLVQALDLFVEIGWPEARELVYQLPEMLR